MVDVLERSQAGGVRRRHIDRDIVGNSEDCAQTEDVVVDGAIEWRHGVLANIDADYSGRSSRTQALGDAFGAIVRKSHPVDDALVVQQAENTRERVPRLGLWSDRPDLHMAEAEREPAVHGNAVLVEA